MGERPSNTPLPSILVLIGLSSVVPSGSPGSEVTFDCYKGPVSKLSTYSVSSSQFSVLHN